MSTNPQDLLASAFLQSSITENEKLAVKAEDVQLGSGIDYSKHFFEPKVGQTYLLKFLPNPGGQPITHRSVYKNLPDPDRKGKSFHYVSSGVAKTCKALELFFELHAAKKEGDAIAEKKIDKWLSVTRQACAKVQILHSPVREEIGQVRLFVFSTAGPNPTIANLIDQKINPSKEKIAQGFEREDIFNIFESSVLSVECVEETYEGGIKGRGYGGSSWAPKKRGAIALLADGTTREFNATDVADGKIIAEALPAFEAFVKTVTHEDYDVYNYFEYKVVDDARNSKDTNDYLKKVFAKVDEIIPIIREKSIAEIEKYGRKDTSSSGDGEKKADKAKSVMAESLPEELSGSVMNEAANVTAPQTDNSPKTKTKAEKAATADSVNEDDILNK